MFSDKRILVTGGTGSIGSEIVRSLDKYNPVVIRVFSNDENEMFNLKNELGNKNKRYIMGDIRDKECISQALENIDIVFHCAALKHVPSCEYSAFEAVKTNILGTQNLIEASFYNNVKQVVNISTDKAVNPVNTMGATKLLAERLIRNANEGKGDKDTIFSTVRFGNVVSSRGSIVPLIKEQLRMGKPVTITNLDMTRYMMRIQDAVSLIFKAAFMMKGGEVFILKMSVVRLGDLVDILVKDKSKIKIIGLRPGEKMHEELMTEAEKAIALEMDDVIIIPLFHSYYPCSHPYSLKEVEPISKDDIRRLL